MLPNDYPNLCEQPSAYRREEFLHHSYAEIVHPSPDDLVQSRNPVGIIHCPVSPAEVLQFGCELRLGGIGRPCVPSVLHPDEAEAEVGEVVGRDNLGLGRIDLEAELPFDEPHHGVHYPVGGGMALDHDDAVIGIAGETEVPRLKFLVELVEHDVGEKRGEVSSLRGSLLRRLEAFSDHHSRLEELPYQRLGVAVADDPSDKAHQPVLRDVVEELLEVDVDNPYIAVVEILQGLHNGVLTSPSRPEAVGAVAEDGFEDGREHLCDCLLDDPVDYRGNA